MTNNQHGQVPEALIDLIDAYAETRHRCGIYNARTEAARNAVIEALSGVQALSAAPAGWKLVPVEPTRSMMASAVILAHGNAVYKNVSATLLEIEESIYGEAYSAMLAASPTPPAEQQATKETSGGFHVWRDISTAPKDGSRFVATGHNYGLYSEVRHTCVAQWFRGCWMEASDWNETSELKYLTHWMPLPSPPDDVAAPAEQQAATTEAATPKAAPVVQPSAVYAGLPERRRVFLCTKCGGRECESGSIHQTHPPCKCGYLGFAENLDFTEDQMRDFADRTHAQRMEQAAPQPAPHLPERDASLPAERQGLFRKFVVSRVDGSDKLGGKHYGCTYFVLDVDHDPCARPALAAYAAACESTHPALAADLRAKWGVVPAPQPSPAPLSDDVVKDAARYRWLREGNDAKHGAAWHVAVNLYGCEWDASIDAALAAQGGKV